MFVWTRLLDTHICFRLYLENGIRMGVCDCLIASTESTSASENEPGVSQL
jgi:hypothetical protein